jgi:two-component system chemotaxis sensor kinase CheA
MSSSFDYSQFIGVFTAEAKDHLGKLNEGVLLLEKNPKKIKIIDELFRAAHSLKGAARTVGFSEIADIAHQVEDIFAAVRSREVRFDSDLANRVFAHLDGINAKIEKIVNGETVTVDSPDPAISGEAAVGGESLAASSEHGDGEPGGEADSPKLTVPVEEYIRVPLKRINTLLNLGGELVINKIKSTQKVSSFRKAIKSAKDLQKRLATMGDHIREIEGVSNVNYTGIIHQCSRDAERVREELESIFDDVMGEALHVDPIVDELQQHIKEIRMLPCSTLFAEFPRLVRDIAREQGKEVEFEIEGGETELDKKVLEGIKQPLIHILRNAIDHAIEQPDERAAQGKIRSGSIQLQAFHRGANVVIEVRDDGRGFDLDRIRAVAIKKGLISEEEAEKVDEHELQNFIFESGFSTSEFITDISGRGVGMDVVRSQIENLKGRVEIHSRKGEGSTIHIELPLTIAIIHVLLVRTGRRKFGIPLSSVEEMARVERTEIQSVENKMAFELRGHTVPLVRLDEALGIPSAPDKDKARGNVVNIVIVNSLYGRVGFLVDELMGREEIYIKSLGSHLGKLRNVSGATILGTGEIIVILDPADMVTSSKTGGSNALQEQTSRSEETVRKLVLVVEDSLTTRELMRSILESEGYLVDTAMDGLDGMEKVAQKNYDIIVSDLEMPRMNGLELCRALKANESYRDIPFVFVTARGSEEEKRKGIEVGAQAYISKGNFDQSNLLGTIHRLV